MFKKFLVSIIILLAALPATFAIGNWYGSVYIDSAAAPVNTYVELYQGSTLKGSGYTGFNASIVSVYNIALSGLSSGDNLTIKVWGISAATDLYTDGQHSQDLSVSTLANGFACSYDNACTSTHCCSGSCAASCTSSGGGGGGSSGGGGGGSSSSSTTNSISANQIWTEMTAGSTATMSISSTGIPITTVNIEMLSSVSNAKVSVISAIPEGIVTSVTKGAYSGTVYQYIEILPQGLTNAEIKQVTIKFKVPKTWVAEKKIKSSQIVLNRFVNSAWTELSTSLLSEDSTYYYYIATTPGFSYFAIGYKGVTPTTTPETTTTTQPAATETTPATTTEPAQTSVTPAESGQPSTTSEKQTIATGTPEKGGKEAQTKKLSVWAWMIPLLALILVIFYFVFKKKPKHHEPHH